MSTNIGEQGYGTPVLVKWVDSKSWAGWQSRDAWKDHLHNASCEVESLGFVINEDSTYLSLAQSWGTENAADVIQIPKAAIIARSRIAEDK